MNWFRIIAILVIFAGCRKEEKVQPFYPHEIKLYHSEWNYHAWIKGMDATKEIPMDYVMYGYGEDLTPCCYIENITFLNDSQLVFASWLQFVEDSKYDNDHAFNYYFRNDSLFYYYWGSHGLGMSPPILITRLVGLGNRRHLIKRWSYLAFGREFYEFGPMYKEGNYDWNLVRYVGMYEYPGPDVNLDTLAVLNFKAGYR